MSRSKRQLEPPASPTSSVKPVANSRYDALPHLINPNAVYLLSTAGKVFGLPSSTLKREARAGRLRVCRRAGRVWTLGSWLLEYFTAGEVRRRPRELAEVDSARNCDH